MFKRKLARQVSVGDLVEIKSVVKKKIIESDNYKKNSIVETPALVYTGFLTKRIFRESNKAKKRFFSADIKLGYVKNSSFFGKNVFEVVPLILEKDNQTYGISSLLNKKKSFLFEKNSLNYASDSYIKKCTTSISYHHLTGIQRKLIDNFSDIKEFSWENR